jgi:hypothetical protein
MQQSTSEADYYSSCAHSTGIRQHLIQTVGVRCASLGFGFTELAGRGTEIGDWALRSGFKSYRRYAGEIQ